MYAADRSPYSLSGANGNGLLLTPPIGILVGILGALIYAYISVYSPIVGIISVIFVLGLGFAVGTAIGWAGKAGHCRSSKLLYLVGFFVGLVTLYFSWVFFEWVLLRRSDDSVGLGALVNIGLSPSTVWEIAASIAETGWYSIKSTQVKGLGSWITWGLEAIALVGLVTVTAGSSLDDSVYCEKDGAWVKKRDDELRLRFPNDEDIAERLTAGQIDDLLPLERADEGEFPRLQLDIWHSPDHPETAAYQLQLELPKVEKDKITGIEQKALSPRYAASTDEIRQLLALADQPVVALPESEPGSAEET